MYSLKLCAAADGIGEYSKKALKVCDYPELLATKNIVCMCFCMIFVATYEAKREYHQHNNV